MMVAGAPSLVRHAHHSGRRRPDGLDGRVPVPLQDDVAEGVALDPLVMVVAEVGPTDDGVARVHVDQLQQALGQPRRRVPSPAGPDQAVRLPAFDVEAHRSAHRVVRLHPPPPLSDPGQVLLEVPRWEAFRVVPTKLGGAAEDRAPCARRQRGDGEISRP